MAQPPEATGRGKGFAPSLGVLPPAQQRLWPELGDTPGGFVLYGGAALALRLGHRPSRDFDFFSSMRFDPAGLLARIPYLQGAEVMLQTRDTLTCRVRRGGALRVSFFGGLDLCRVGTPDRAAVFGPQFNPLPTLKALTSYSEGALGNLPEPVRGRLTVAVREVDPDRLPIFRAWEGLGGASGP